MTERLEDRRLLTESAVLADESFENGLSGWTANAAGGQISTTNRHYLFIAESGDQFALLKSGNADQPVTLSKTFSLQPGDRLSGVAFFHTVDQLPRNDSGGVRLLRLDGTELKSAFRTDVSQSGTFIGSGWVAWSYAATVFESITVQAWVMNAGDRIADSYVGLDHVQVVTSSNVFVIDENTGKGLKVGDVVIAANDPWPASRTLRLLDGNTGGAFKINKAGKLAVANKAALDFETTPEFHLSLEIDDHQAGSPIRVRTLVVKLRDVSEDMLLDSSLWTDAGLTISQNAAHTEFRVTRTGNPSQVVRTMPISTMDRLVFQGRANASDTLTVDLVNGPLPPLKFQAGDGASADQLRLKGYFSENGWNSTFAPNGWLAGNVTFATQGRQSKVEYAGVESLWDETPHWNKAFQFGSGNNVISLDHPDLSDGWAKLTDTLTGASIKFLDAEIKGVIILGGAGNDQITISQAASTSSESDRLKVFGEAGNDQLLGTTTNRCLHFLGGAGDDTLSGGTAWDSLEGGDGNDLVQGGNNRDTLLGDAGNDTLLGQTGPDILFGGIGDDSVNGGGGSDLFAEAGDANFTLSRNQLIGLGTDRFSAIENVRLTGGRSANRIEITDYPGPVSALGLGGNDTLIGGIGNDSLDGGTGNDSIHGGDGRDTVMGYDGNDTLLGDAGEDYLGGQDGDDLLLGGIEGDQLLGGAGNDSLAGGDGDDYLGGGIGNDILLGQAGNDQITAWISWPDVDADDDLFIGGTGIDTLSGSQSATDGRDTMLGGSGSPAIGGTGQADLGDVLTLATVIDEQFSQSFSWAG